MEELIKQYAFEKIEDMDFATLQDLACENIIGWLKTLDEEELLFNMEENGHIELLDQYKENK